MESTRLQIELQHTKRLLFIKLEPKSYHKAFGQIFASSDIAFQLLLLELLNFYLSAFNSYAIIEML